MAPTCAYKCDPLLVTACHCSVISLLYLRSPISKVDSQINSSLFPSYQVHCEQPSRFRRLPTVCRDPHDDPHDRPGGPSQGLAAGTPTLQQLHPFPSPWLHLGLCLGRLDLVGLSDASVREGWVPRVWGPSRMRTPDPRHPPKKEGGTSRHFPRCPWEATPKGTATLTHERPHLGWLHGKKGEPESDTGQSIASRVARQATAITVPFTVPWMHPRKDMSRFFLPKWAALRYEPKRGIQSIRRRKNRPSDASEARHLNNFSLQIEDASSQSVLTRGGVHFGEKNAPNSALRMRPRSGILQNEMCLPSVKAERRHL